MRYVNNILTLSLLTLLLATGCATPGQIPNIRFYAEIPFVDCPEGVYFDRVTHAQGTISCGDWAKQRPYMIMIDPTGKKAIFSEWSQACRFSGSDCSVQMTSVKTVIDQLDAIAGQVLKAQ